MAAATANRDGQRQPSVVAPYTGSSGYTYYKDTLVMKSPVGAVIQPVVQGAGASNARFIGVVKDRVDLSAGLGASNHILNLWKTGEFTFATNGTGTSAHIGQGAFALDDQTVGISAGVPVVRVGEIVGLPSTSSYRVRIDGSVGAVMSSVSLGASWTTAQN